MFLGKRKIRLLLFFFFFKFWLDKLSLTTAENMQELLNQKKKKKNRVLIQCKVTSQLLATGVRN